MAINTVRVDGVDYDIEDIYPIELIYKEKTHQENKEIKDFSWGDMTPSMANANSVVSKYNGTFWMTDYMSPMVGNKLKSVTLHGNTEGGTITFLGNKSISCDKTITDGSIIKSIATNLRDSADTIEVFSITVTEGLQTYLLDGTDNRVTILNQEAVDSCPLTMGVCKATEPQDTSTFKFNSDNLTDSEYLIFFHLGFGTGDISPARKSGLAISFEYEETTIIDDAAKLQMTLNNDEILEVELPIEESNGNTNVLAGKKISILGDSISTFSGYIPDGYGPYYPYGDINSVEKTWWYQLITENEMNLIKNASWSGSCVTGDSTSTTNAFAGCSDARINDLSNGTIKPDIIVIFIGINDFALTYHRELGDFTGETAIPSEGTIETFSEAYGLMLKKVLTNYPTAKVFCCTLLETAREGYDTGENGTYPTINNNGVALCKFNERIKTITSNLGANIIDLHSCGIHYWNLSINTIDSLHPNTTGAVLIKEYIEKALKRVI